MRLVIETEDHQEKAILVEKNSSILSRGLRKHINAYDIHTNKTSSLPYSFNDIDYMFIIKDSYTEGELRQIFQSSTKILVITSEKKIFTQFESLIEQNRLKHVKIVLVSLDEDNPDVIERILWFMLRSSREMSLDVHSDLPRKSAPSRKRKKFTVTLTRKRLVIAALFVFFMLHILFILPLAGTTYYIYRAGTQLRDQTFDSALSHISRAESLFHITESTYALAKPGLQFLFLSIIPENLMSIQENSISFIQTAIASSENTRALARLLLDTQKNSEEINEARIRVQELEQQVTTLGTTSQNVYDRLDYDISAVQEIRKDFETIAGYLQTGSQLIGHLDTILGDNSQKNYVFFFYNNMEIRPGGGFIGSFAHVAFQDYTLKTFEVYDVYDADGQLKTHVRPPAPIREYLDQPHWFLRDSNFSPDFEQNVQTAEFFLDRELNLNNFDGAVGLTTTALTYILEAFGDVHIVDFDQTINADNFYLTAQGESEIDFFPGSSQKKSFLSTVGRTLLLKLEDADPAKLGLAIKRSLDEKHIVVLNDNPEVQSDIDTLGWSGKIINPQCISSSTNCIINHILPVDANLGVNKANYFVSKLMKLKTVIAASGSVQNELSMSFTNNSSPGVFPGGTYKNYFQVYIPHNARIEQIDIDGQKVTDYDESKTGFFKIIGLLLTIEPKETAIVTFSYELNSAVKSGENAYQIVLQKQIGSFNNEFSLEVQLPRGVLITDQNFKSVAKNNSVLYNSSLSTNKIFVIEFVKE